MDIADAHDTVNNFIRSLLPESPSSEPAEGVFKNVFYPIEHLFNSTSEFVRHNWSNWFPLCWIISHPSIELPQSDPGRAIGCFHQKSISYKAQFPRVTDRHSFLRFFLNFWRRTGRPPRTCLRNFVVRAPGSTPLFQVLVSMDWCYCKQSPNHQSSTGSFRSWDFLDFASIFYASWSQTSIVLQSHFRFWFSLISNFFLSESLIHMW